MEFASSLPPIPSFPPDRDRLEAALAAMLDDKQLAVVERWPSIQGTFPKEIVRCRLSAGATIDLFCKYTSTTSATSAHRRGVEHEARVYREILGPMGLSMAMLHGVFTDSGRREFWLVLEHLEGSMRVKKEADPRAMPAAASWIGNFHAKSELRAGIGADFLEPYDVDSELGGAQLTSRRSPGALSEPGWSWWPGVMTALRSAPQMIIHCEYYPKNILSRDGVIYPVDWESAAIGPGEIDLASLIAGWPEEIAETCVAHYRKARGASAVAYDFERTLDAARLYLLLRELGAYPPDSATLRQLLTMGERLGFVQAPD